MHTENNLLYQMSHMHGILYTYPYMYPTSFAINLRNTKILGAKNFQDITHKKDPIQYLFHVFPIMT